MSKKIRLLLEKLVDLIRAQYRTCFGEYSERSGKCVRRLENDDHDCEVCFRVSKIMKK